MVPGISISALGCQLECARTTVEHHVRPLIKRGLVQVTRLGRDRRFFPSAFTPLQALRVAVLRRERIWTVADAVLRRPGIGQKDLTEELEVSRKVLRDCVTILTRMGLLEEVRDTKFRRYFPSTQLRPSAEQVRGRPECGPTPSPSDPRPD